MADDIVAGWFFTIPKRASRRVAHYYGSGKLSSMCGLAYRNRKNPTFDPAHGGHLKCSHCQGHLARLSDQASLLPNDAMGQHDGIPYRMLRMKLTDEQIERAAHASHEINCLYCHALGDDSHVAWEDAPPWQRESAIAGVRAYAEDPFMLPEQGHQQWMDRKFAEGWVYGPDKHAGHKTHPCLVPYDELPLPQRMKDTIFRAVVLGVLGSYGE